MSMHVACGWHRGAASVLWALAFLYCLANIAFFSADSSYFFVHSSPAACFSDLCCTAFIPSSSQVGIHPTFLPNACTLGLLDGMITLLQPVNEWLIGL